MSAQRRQTHRITIAADEGGKRLDRALAARLPELSRSRLKALIEAGCLSIAGETIVEPAYRVKPGQALALRVPAAAPAGLEGQAFALDILYEDPDILVLDKPAGLVVHPAPGNPDRTLVNALVAHCGAQLSGIGGLQRPGIVHRLDKDTSGLMVVAKSEAAHHGLSRLFATRALERSYLAVVWGVPAPRQGEIAGNIGRHPRNRKKMTVLRRGGKPARTRYRVVRAFAGDLASLVECRLLTGRTHQIRVHLAERAHPLLGDPLYGRATSARLRALSEPARAALAGLRRQALHAKTLGFRHPISAAELRFESDLPADLKSLINCLEAL